MSVTERTGQHADRLLRCGYDVQRSKVLTTLMRLLHVYSTYEIRACGRSWFPYACMPVCLYACKKAVAAHMIPGAGFEEIRDSDIGCWTRDFPSFSLSLSCCSSLSLARRIYEILQVCSRYAVLAARLYGISTRPALSEWSGPSCDGMTDSKISVSSWTAACARKEKFYAHGPPSKQMRCIPVRMRPCFFVHHGNLVATSIIPIGDG